MRQPSPRVRYMGRDQPRITECGERNAVDTCASYARGRGPKSRCDASVYALWTTGEIPAGVEFRWGIVRYHTRSLSSYRRTGCLSLRHDAPEAVYNRVRGQESWIASEHGETLTRRAGPRVSSMSVLRRVDDTQLHNGRRVNGPSIGCERNVSVLSQRCTHQRRSLPGKQRWAAPTT